MGQIKEKTLKIIYKLLYEPFYLLYFSLKDAILSVGESLAELKKPRSWLVVLIGSLLLAIYTKRNDLIKWFIPPIIIVYVIRQKLDGKYRKEIKEKALINDNDILLEGAYRRYKIRQHYRKKEPLEYSEWKREELRKLD